MSSAAGAARIAGRKNNAKAAMMYGVIIEAWSVRELKMLSAAVDYKGLVLRGCGLPGQLCRYPRRITSLEGVEPVWSGGFNSIVCNGCCTLIGKLLGILWVIGLWSDNWLQVYQ